MKNDTADAFRAADGELSSFLQTCHGFVVPLLCSGLVAMLRYHNPTRHRIWLSIATYVGKWWWSSKQKREPTKSGEFAEDKSSQYADLHDNTWYHSGADALIKIYEMIAVKTNHSPGVLRGKKSGISLWSFVKLSLVPLLEVGWKANDDRRVPSTTNIGDTLDSETKDSRKVPFIESAGLPDKIPVVYKQLVLRDSSPCQLQHKQPMPEENRVVTLARVQLTATEIVGELQPVRPLVLSRPEEAILAAQEFISAADIQTMYAVKANDDPLLLTTLWDAGIHWFEVASIFEIQHVLSILPSPKSPTFCFMNPVKPEEDIRTAYFDCNVRVFALHSYEELEKIIRATTKDGHKAEDLELFVRLKVSSKYAELDLNPKFGIEGVAAVELLQRMKREGRKFGVCFHVGSQVTDVSDFRTAMCEVRELQEQAGVEADMSVGGGFGVPYPGKNAPTISECLEMIKTTWKELFEGRKLKLYCEPGRALAAKSESLVARVEERRGMELYVNVGAYDMMSDAARINWCYDVNLLRHVHSAAQRRAFSLWGPTGDSVDYLPGPFLIPEDVKEGDYIEIMNTGAYGRVLLSRFNGLGEFGQIVVEGLAPKGSE